MTNYLKNLKNSKTCRAALLKKVIGVLAIIAANLGYFEGMVSPQTFATISGVIAIALGLHDYYLRTITTEALDKK